MKNDALIMGGLALAVLGVLWYAKNAVGNGLAAAQETLQQAVPYVDPTDTRNVAYTAASKVTQAMTGSSDASFGTWLYDISH